MLIVSPDPDLVERQLENRELVCPGCMVGVLGRHGWVGRFVRRDGVDGGGGGSAGEARVRLRRGACRAKGCGATHVLLPCTLLERRLDEVTVIGRAVTLRLEGRSWAVLAARLGRPVSTIRGWWRRLSAGAGRLRVAFSTALHQLEWDAPAVLAPAGSPVADAVAAIAQTAAAVRRLLGATARAASPWQVVSVLTNGGLLRPVPPWQILQPARADLATRLRTPAPGGGAGAPM